MELSSHQEQVSAGARFRFGENWTRFLAVLDDVRIEEAKRSLRDMLGLDSLSGKRFIDVGCGSGLFSLAARCLGAQVSSFDFDPQSVACARELRRRYFPDDPSWQIVEGSVLDREFLASSGQFDIVYAWGVLHHTGDMWRALDHVARLVAPSGSLFISIYNDQGLFSKLWTKVKKFNCNGLAGRVLVKAIFIPYFVIRGLLADLLKRNNPIARYTAYKRQRGMSIVYDWYDWLGGYPFEVAKPEEIFDFYLARGFELRRLSTCAGGLGCNQFVFASRPSRSDGADLREGPRSSVA